MLQLTLDIEWPNDMPDFLRALLVGRHDALEAAEVAFNRAITEIAGESPGATIDVEARQQPQG